jgi:hypothetical protein
MISFRLKGTRRIYRLTADQLYLLALKAELRLKHLEKARKVKSAPRGWKFK